MADHKAGRPVALVTGAAGGIGGGICRQLARSGFDLVLSDFVPSDTLSQLCDDARRAGARAAVVMQDLRRTEELDAFIGAAIQANGRLDCLVNNAGVSVISRGDILDVSPESFDRCVEVNLRSSFFLTQRLARAWLAEAPPPASRPRKSIITISSVAADMVGHVLAEYCISKAGLASMVKQFASRLVKEGVDCYEIRPGMISTSMTESSRIKYDKLIASGFVPAGRWGEADDVGKAVASLACGAIPYASGQTIYVDGGMSLHSF